MSRSLEVTWNEVTRLLRGARRLLPAEVGGASGEAPSEALRRLLDEFNEFLDHNELELAWEALADAGQLQGAPGAFWKQLAEAASLMNLPEKRSAAEQNAEAAASDPIQ